MSGRGRLTSDAPVQYSLGMRGSRRMIFAAPIAALGLG